jgi:hypothetical protein
MLPPRVLPCSRGARIPNPTILQQFVNVSIHRGHPYPAPAPHEVKETKIPESAVRTEQAGPLRTLIRSRPVERKTTDPQVPMR